MFKGKVDKSHLSYWKNQKLALFRLFHICFIQEKSRKELHQVFWEVSSPGIQLFSCTGPRKCCWLTELPTSSTAQGQGNILKLVPGTKPISISHCFCNRDACAVHQIVCDASPVPRKQFCESNALFNFVSLKSGLQLLKSGFGNPQRKFLDIEVAELWRKFLDIEVPNCLLTYKTTTTLSKLWWASCFSSCLFSVLLLAWSRK